MKKNIRVKCNDGFKVYDNHGERIIAYVKVGEYDAKLYEKTGEYFAKDSQRREFLVGEINIDKNLVLEPEFELIEE